MMYRLLLGSCSALLFVLLLCTCDRAAKNDATTVVAGTIRYQQDNQLLEASLRLLPIDTTASATYPTLFGTVMAPAPLIGPDRFRTRRTVAFPNTFRLTVPCSAGPNCPLDYQFTPPFSDSIPPSLTIGQSAQFPIANTGLAANESLVIFFEPTDRSAPKRIQLLGPTSTGTLTLRKEVFSDIPAGEYEVYLVKQQLQKDSSASIIASFQTEYFTKAMPLKIME
ncbi:MAG: hypothetical protein AAF597_07310 [Bacteroidota bacterium]